MVLRHGQQHRPTEKSYQHLKHGSEEEWRSPGLTRYGMMMCCRKSKKTAAQTQMGHIVRHDLLPWNIINGRMLCKVTRK